jgi:opacity protein-like surface antigen
MEKLILLAFMIGAMALPARAQETPKAELFGGYAYAGSGSHGFDSSVVANINSWFGLGGSVSGQYSRFNEDGISERITTNSFLVGPKFSVRTHKRFTPFAQAMVGLARIHTETNEFGPVVTFKDRSFAMTIGGGLDVTINRLVAIRAIQIDYLRTHFFNETQNKGRIAFGVVLRFGTKEAK